MLEYRKTEVMENWNVGLLEYWNIEKDDFMRHVMGRARVIGRSLFGANDRLVRTIWP